MDNLSAKQLLFCELVSKGYSLSKAYVDSYLPNQTKSSVIGPKASKLAKRDYIKAKIEELKQETMLNSTWDRRRLLEETQRIHQLSIGKNQFNVALKSLELIGRICGLLVDKSEVKVEHTLYANLSMEQLERIANHADSVGILDRQAPIIDVEPKQLTG